MIKNELLALYYPSERALSARMEKIHNYENGKLISFNGEEKEQAGKQTGKTQLSRPSFGRPNPHPLATYIIFQFLFRLICLFNWWSSETKSLIAKIVPLILVCLLYGKTNMMVGQI
jgi:hypothetical protein